MATSTYSRVSTRATPQTEPIRGTVRNSAGGQSYEVNDWTRLERFLILGTEGGSYYASEQKLTRENADALFRCIEADGQRTVRTIRDVSVAGRNIKQDPALFALAACAGADDLATRSAALGTLPQVARTGTHLFMFARYVEQFRGWGRGLRSAIGEWYTHKDAATLGYQLSKYPQRDGWSHRDLLRLSKPQPERGSAVDRSLAWAVGKGEGAAASEYLGGVDAIRSARSSSEAAALITQHRLPWEVVPSELLASPEVWEALVPSMPIGALVRNLGRMTANGAIKPLSATTDIVTSRLADEAAVRGSRIHPINVLMAGTVYAQGRGVKGSLSWTPVGAVSDALETTFDLSFANIEPANKRTLVAVDVSGSMDWSNIAGTFITPRVGAAAMALATVRSEPKVHTMAFSHRLVDVNLTKRDTLASTVQKFTGISMGGTDCALPMKYAQDAGLDVDTFVVYTDSETWAGTPHPAQALRSYRESSGIPARLIVVGMVANWFSIADPNDRGMLDVVGFDSSAPSVMADFSAGRL